MSRRTGSLLVAGLLLVALCAVAWLRPVPYVAMRPGPVKDTLGELGGAQVVEISGRRTFPTTGRLDLTTVSVTAPTAGLTLGDALVAWFHPQRALVPRDLYYPPQQSVEQAEHESAVAMASSQDTAIIAALEQMGIEVPLSVVVRSVQKGGPAQGHLRVGDLITAVDGEPVRGAVQVSRLLQQTPPGQRATFAVRRDGETVQVQSPTEAAPDDPSRTMVGITIADDPRLPFKVSIELGSRIGGPSAGLMFSMAIVDKLTPGSLTGGMHVAGTGTITADGRVGPIGGIGQKVAGADNADAAVFLVPAANCAEAVQTTDPGDMTLVRVRTLDAAVDAVEGLAQNPKAKVPTCG
ncbi:MAG: PDZ domain-containing protein [Actinomycetota bacterium]|nr:PDZ domain-containing protein [Actinomycetota bacterium]